MNKAYPYGRYETTEEKADRRRIWWADKKEWFRQKYKSEGDITDNDKLNAMVARMWNIMGEEKKQGVLNGTYAYTGKGLSLNPEGEDMGKYEHLEMKCEI